MKYRIVADEYGNLFVEKKVLKYFWRRDKEHFGYTVEEIESTILKDIEIEKNRKCGNVVIKYVGEE